VSKNKYGPAIGTHLGKPIFSTIESEEGKYKFDRLAECDRDGCPLGQLQKDELMFNPGLIYKTA